MLLHVRLGVGALTLALSLGCADPEEPPGSSAPVVDTTTAPTDDAQLRRLTQREFVTSMAHVLGVRVEADLDPDLWLGGMARVGATKVSTSRVGIERYALAIESAMGGLTSDSARWEAFVGCAPSTAECRDAFVRDTGQRAWRRPLSLTEREKYQALFDTCAAEAGDPSVGYRCVTSALLQSPNFLYRVELPNGGFYKGYAMASRLSYLLHGAPPDSALLTHAAQGRLDTADGVREVAREMLAAPAAEAGVRAFVDEWFQLDRLDDRLPRDILAETHEPLQFELGSTGSLQPWLRWMTFAAKEELRRMVVDNVLVREVDYLDLLLTDSTFVDPQLAAFYELPIGDGEPSAIGTGERSPDPILELTGTPDALGFAPARHTADSPRQGILSTMAVLSQLGKQNETSPTRRGLYVMEKILCLEVGEPPDEIDQCARPDGVSRRSSIEDHHLCAASCQGCHTQMDPIGFAMDGFDTLGRWRQVDDWGYELDTRVTWTLSHKGKTERIDFDSTKTMTRAFHGLTEASSCVVKQVYRAGTGRMEEDEAMVSELTDAFAADGRVLKRFLIHFVGTDAFRKVAERPAAPAGPVTTQRVHDTIFVESCAPCHIGGTSLGGLELSMREGLEAALMLPSQQLSTMPLITPGDPDRSYLWRKVTGEHVSVGGSGDPMPPSGEMWTEEELELMRAWILEMSR